jgi:elongation factor Ts
MSKVTLKQIKTLRSKTKAGVMDCRRALEANDGKIAAAEKWLLKKGIASAGKKADRETTQGIVNAYTHPGSRIVAVVELRCETDFVAKTEEFKKLAHELSMQVAAMAPDSAKELLKQAWIRDEKKTVAALVKEAIGKLGENIRVVRVARFELGK